MHFWAPKSSSPLTIVKKITAKAVNKRRFLIFRYSRRRHAQRPERTKTKLLLNKYVFVTMIAKISGFDFLCCLKNNCKTWFLLKLHALYSVLTHFQQYKADHRGEEHKLPMTRIFRNRIWVKHRIYLWTSFVQIRITSERIFLIAVLNNDLPFLTFLLHIYLWSWYLISRNPSGSESQKSKYI